jgi:hypothetical protein
LLLLKVKKSNKVAKSNLVTPLLYFFITLKRYQPFG